MSEDRNWPFTFRVNTFVRERRARERWGQIVSPSKLEGRWIVQYAHGGRIEPSTDQLEVFQPTSAEQAKMSASFAQYHAAIEADKLARPHLYQKPH